MSVNLTYYVRSGVISGTVAGARVTLPTQHGSGGDVGSWSKLKGLDIEFEVVEYGEGTESTSRSESLPTAPVPLPRYASTCLHHLTKQRVVAANDGVGGFLIHGWPPCNGRRCLIVVHGWDAFVSALGRGGRGRLSVVY
jgi:hypothetical protein